MPRESQIGNPYLQNLYEEVGIKWTTSIIKVRRSDKAVPGLRVTLPNVSEAMPCNRCDEAVKVVLRTDDYPIGDTGVWVRFRNVRGFRIKNCAVDKALDGAGAIYMFDLSEEERDAAVRGCVLANNPSIILEQQEIKPKTLFFVQSRLREENINAGDLSEPRQLKEILSRLI